VWHYEMAQWLDIEGPGSPDSLAVLMAGETLSYLTNGAMFVLCLYDFLSFEPVLEEFTMYLSSKVSGIQCHSSVWREDQRSSSHPTIGTQMNPTSPSMPATLCTTRARSVFRAIFPKRSCTPRTLDAVHEGFAQIDKITNQNTVPSAVNHERMEGSAIAHNLNSWKERLHN
jgi:hypothetical protein